MDLSADVLEGLQLTGDTVQVSNKCFSALLKAACDSLLDTKRFSFESMRNIYLLNYRSNYSDIVGVSYE